MDQHLASFNVFREADGSLSVTCASADGVKRELNGSGAPLYLCAMNALYSAVDQMRERERESHKPVKGVRKGRKPIAV